MDTLGAVIGPLLAVLYLYKYPAHYKSLFLIALAPGILAVLCSFLLKDRNRKPKFDIKRVSFFSFISYWKNSPALYHRLLIGLLLFTLFNSSDVFLLLRAKQSGLSDQGVIIVYIFYNLVYAAFAYPVGMLADRLGLKTIFIYGLCIFAIVYFGMALKPNLYLFYGLFFLYGLYAAATESVAKAWISNISDKKDTATAIGTYTGFQSICTLIASSLAGFIWFEFGAAATFFVTGIATIIVVIYISMIPFFRPAA